MFEIGMVGEIKHPNAKRSGYLSEFFQETMDIFTDQISFKIDFITNPKSAQISVPQGKWDDCRRKAVSSIIINR
jgi:hypothetical protein